METTAYYAFGVPLYVAVLLLEGWAAKRRGHPVPSFPNVIGNVSAGLGAIAVGLGLGPALLLLYGFGERFALVHWAPGGIAVWVIAMIGADFGHYCHHRLDHRVAACWAVHGVHHQPVEMDFSVAMRHAWFSDLYSFPFYAPLPLLGVPASHFFIATTLLSVHALITHSAEYNFPGFGFLVTPRSHIVHHAKNPRYLDRNFGAMFSVWDRLFGTHVALDPAEPPVWGTVHGYETHDGALSQWVLWRDLFAIAARAQTWRDRVRVFVMRPGWTPPGVVAPPAVPPRSTAEIPHATKVYVLAQFLVTCAASLWVFVLRDQHPWPLLAAATIAILASLSTLGGLLDGRRMAWTWEGARLACVAVAVFVVAV